MSDEYPLTLRQADQARADFAAIESELQVIQAQLAKLPTRTYLSRTVLLAILSLCALLVLLTLIR